MKTIDDFIGFCRNCIASRKEFLEAAMAEKIRVTEYNSDNVGVDITDDYIERFQTEIATFEALISDLKDAVS